ncbi:MAG: hypothetical protein ACFFDN_16240 [Candidatus Hodarchaeota archaeon]
MSICIYCKAEVSPGEQCTECFPKEKKKKMYCKKCNKMVEPVKPRRTLGKSTVNFITAVLTQGGTVYTYQKKCPYCGKAIRTKAQKIAGLICVIWIIVAVILGIIVSFNSF